RIVADSLPDYSAAEDAAAAEEEAAGEDATAEEPTAEASEGAEEGTEESEEGAASESPSEPAGETSEEQPAGSPQVATSDEGITVDDVWAKVGEEAAAMAQGLTAAPSDEASIAALEPFGELTPEEVGLLPANVQFYVPSITCEQLDNRPPGSVQQPDVEVVACSPPEPLTQ